MIVPFGFYALSAIALGMVIALLTYAGNRKNLTPPPLPPYKPHPYPLSRHVNLTPTPSPKGRGECGGTLGIK